MEHFVGLDLVPEGCPKAGHEAEWRRLIERSFAEEQLSERDIAQLNEISIPGHERLGAPRVGSDPAADAWIIATRKAQTPEEVAATLKEFAGYYVLQLLRCDGVPDYSNGGLYDGVDETSFRGQLLKNCTNVLDRRLLNDAWEHKFPDAALEYGRALLDAADVAEKAPREARRGLLVRLGLAKAKEPLPLAEQLDIVRAAGRWFVFWGERGHPIRAYF